MMPITEDQGDNRFETPLPPERKAVEAGAEGVAEDVGDVSELDEVAHCRDSARLLGMSDLGDHPKSEAKSVWYSAPRALRKRKQLTVTLSDEERLALEMIAEAVGASISRVVGALIENEANRRGIEIKNILCAESEP